MKKIFAFAAFAAMIFAAGSCQKNETIGGRGEACVTKFSVEMPQEAQTRSVSEGENVDVVYYEIWDEDFANILGSGEEAITGGRLEKEFVLVKNQTYNFIFWAQKGFESDAPFSWDNLKKIKIDYSKFTSNNKDCYDAFYSTAADIVADGNTKTVYLTRPFAQLNFGASTMNADSGEFAITANTVTVSKHAKAFDTIKGTAVEYVDAPVTFTASTGGLVQSETQDDKDLKVGDGAYYWVAMNYLLVPAEQSTTVTVDATFTTQIGTVKHKILNVPINKNYRTNIVGDLFTTSSTLKIVIEESFLTPDENKYLNN